MDKEDIGVLAKKMAFFSVIFLALLFIFIGTALVGGIGVAFLATGIAIIFGGVFAAMMWSAIFD